MKGKEPVEVPVVLPAFTGITEDERCDSIMQSAVRELPMKSMTNMTILELMEEIAKRSKKSGLEDSFFVDNKKLLEVAGKRLDLNPIQVVLFTAIVEMNYNSCDIASMRRHFGCTTISLVKHFGELEELFDRGWIKECTIFDEPHYTLNSYTLADLIENKTVQKRTTVEDEMEFFHHIESLMKKIMDPRDKMDEAANINKLRKYISKNTKYDFAKVVNQLFNDGVQDVVFFVYCCLNLILSAETVITDSFARRLFSSAMDASKTLRTLHDGTHDLFKLGLLQYDSYGGLTVNDNYRITNSAISKLGLEPYLLDNYSEMNESMFNIKNAEDITEKQLFFNCNVSKQVSDLEKILDEDRYKTVIARLEESGMRKGIACLFYGTPGTGKTETVYQLARRSGRSIMKVEMSQITDKYVGETEKNIKGIFDDYRRLVEKSEITPILLFNEADAIFGKRIQVEHSTDQMRNTVQNIMLDEMEHFEGIMIATTNLTSNLDSAFDRRFIFKVSFEKPETEIRAKIWKSIVKGLDDNTAYSLARDYNFSGGQIENVSRKYLIEYAISGTPMTRELLDSYCRSEHIVDADHHRVAGFQH